MKNTKRCGRCQAFGHNSRTCQGGPTKKQIIEAARRKRLAQASSGSQNAEHSGVGTSEASGNRGGRGRGNKSVAARCARRGKQARGGSASRGRGSNAIDAPVNIPQAPPPPTRNPINIPPPPPPRNPTAVSQASKRRKIFHPPSVNYLP